MIIAATLAIFLSASAPQRQPIGMDVQQPDSAGAMVARISLLEESNRKLKGEVEELEYKLNQLQNENSKLKAEANKNKIESDTASAKQNTPKPKVVIEPSDDDEDIEPIPAAKPVADAPNNDFNKSFEDMTEGNIEEAKKGFNAFVKKYPSSSLSGEAYYWLGEIAYDSADYNSAAINYLKGYREYPKGTKAPENILKLAQTLKQMGKTDEACQNLARFNTEFKNAHANLLAKARSSSQELKCK